MVTVAPALCPRVRGFRVPMVLEWGLKKTLCRVMFLAFEQRNGTERATEAEMSWVPTQCWYTFIQLQSFFVYISGSSSRGRRVEGC